MNDKSGKQTYFIIQNVHIALYESNVKDMGKIIFITILHTTIAHTIIYLSPHPSVNREYPITMITWHTIYLSTRGTLI